MSTNLPTPSAEPALKREPTSRRRSRVLTRVAWGCLALGLVIVPTVVALNPRVGAVCSIVSGGSDSYAEVLAGPHRRGGASTKDTWEKSLRLVSNAAGQVAYYSCGPNRTNDDGLGDDVVPTASETFWARRLMASAALLPVTMMEDTYMQNVSVGVRTIA